jgi:hypothetical protein
MGCSRGLSFRAVSVMAKDCAGEMGFANWAKARGN